MCTPPGQGLEVGRRQISLLHWPTAPRPCVARSRLYVPPSCPRPPLLLLRAGADEVDPNYARRRPDFPRSRPTRPPTISIPSRRADCDDVEVEARRAPTTSAAGQTYTTLQHLAPASLDSPLYHAAKGLEPAQQVPKRGPLTPTKTIGNRPIFLHDPLRGLSPSPRSPHARAHTSALYLCHTHAGQGARIRSSRPPLSTTILSAPERHVYPCAGPPLGMAPPLTGAGELRSRSRCIPHRGTPTAPPSLPPVASPPHRRRQTDSSGV